MSMGKIERIIDALRHERYRFKPVRRHYIPKKDGKKRPLGLPSWSDKLVGEVVRLLLEAYYEPQFSDCSHGFRPGRGCHTALREVANTWTGTTWFIEGDISRCFDELDHQVMLATLGEKIHDHRLLRLISQMLAAGYLEDWVWGATLSGALQGGVLSPCLSNIYLSRLDAFVETVLMPEYTRGVRRKSNSEHKRITAAIGRARKRGDHAAVRALRLQQRRLPGLDPYDPEYRRLRYVRYPLDRIGDRLPCLDLGGAIARDRRAVRRAASAAREARAEGPTLTARRHARPSCRVVAGDQTRATRRATETHRDPAAWKPRREIRMITSQGPARFLRSFVADPPCRPRTSPPCRNNVSPNTRGPRENDVSICSWS